MLVACMIATTALPSAADEPGEIEILRREIQTLRERDAARQTEIDELRRELQGLKATVGTHQTIPAKTLHPAGGQPAVPSALDQAVADLPTNTAPSIATAPRTSGAIASRRVGNANLRLIDISMDVLWAAGGSTAPDPEIEQLQAGFHDPRQRGFTLQQAELGLAGAVDPYFRADAFIIATTDTIELEEAFLTSTSLPWGLQLEAGSFFTEFGINNRQHPHEWDWIDQPVVNSRMFGGEALRGPGFRLGWLTPLPWFSELHVGMQNANEGEFTSSFIGEDQVGGRPQVKRNVDSMSDLLYLTRWVNSWDLDDSLTTRIGLSSLFGPNGTGNDARTYIYGVDMFWLWQPVDHFRGWPFVSWQTEAIMRDFEADRFVAGTEVEDDGGEGEHGHARSALRYARAAQDDHDDDHDDEGELMDLPSNTLHDWGTYSQVLWGFRRPWALGVRYEYASGTGASLPDGRSADSLRDNRHRVSPLILWQPTEFTRFRLQYNFDRADFLDDDEAHSFWFSMEVLYGAHMAHPF